MAIGPPGGENIFEQKIHFVVMYDEAVFVLFTPYPEINPVIHAVRAFMAAPQRARVSVPEAIKSIYKNARFFDAAPVVLLHANGNALAADIDIFVVRFIKR